MPTGRTPIFRPEPETVCRTMRRRFFESLSMRPSRDIMAIPPRGERAQDRLGRDEAQLCESRLCLDASMSRETAF